MSKFNSLSGITATAAEMAAYRAATGTSPLRSTSATPDAVTHEGGPAHTREARSELFLLCVTGFVAENTFYETADARTTRLRDLVGRIVAQDADGADSGEWFYRFTLWLRGTANIRTAAVMVAAEAVHARLAAGHHGLNREIVGAALLRADEPGEFVAYWLSRFTRPGGDKTLPKPVKRGLADAAVRLYDEYATLRYDTGSHGVRFGDVVELAQPRTNARLHVSAQQSALMRHLIDRRHHYNTADVPAELEMLRARASLDVLPVEHRRTLVETAAADRESTAAQWLSNGGMTWEWLASWLQGPMDETAWRVALPGMGYMALLRNLRNLDEAGVGGVAADWVADRLADPRQVARSRQFPYRFLSAYEAVRSDRWRVALGKALDASIANLPELGGTLILVDTSASMENAVSSDSVMTRVKVASLFGVALAARSRTSELYGFATGAFAHPVLGGVSILRETERFCARIGEVGHGTQMVEAVRKTFRPDRHKRVVIISDEQAFGSYYGTPADQVPADVPFYAFNLGGHRSSVTPDAPNRHSLGSLTDATFRFIDLIEKGQQQVGWPWETDG
jgi:hypothetical protein